jgi:branched-chain amino acid transport system permease protein
MSQNFLQRGSGLGSPTLLVPRSRNKTLVPVGIAVVCGALMVFWASGAGFRADLLILVSMYALISLGMYIPFVMAGSMSLAYSAYAAIGGYSIAIIETQTKLPVIVGWVLGPLISAAVAIVLSLLTRRLSGFYLAAVTLLFGEAFTPWITSAQSLTNGASGIGIAAPNFFGWEPPRLFLVSLALALVILLTALIERVRTGAWGVTARAIRDVPSAVDATGVRTATFTTVSLAVGAAVASLAGALFVSFILSINPETFTLSVVFLAVFIPLVGGQASAWGCALGAIIVVQLTLNTPAFGQSGQLVLAIGVLLILLLAPAGILGWLTGLFKRIRERARKRV